MPSNNCPNCKAPTLSFVRAGLYVECTAVGCGWTQAPLEELVIEMAVATWHRQNPTPRPLDHEFEDVFDFLDDECSAVVDEDEFSVSRCGKPASEHERYVAPDEPRDAEHVWCSPL